MYSRLVKIGANRWANRHGNSRERTQRDFSFKKNPLSHIKLSGSRRENPTNGLWKNESHERAYRQVNQIFLRSIFSLVSSADSKHVYFSPYVLICMCVCFSWEFQSQILKTRSGFRSWEKRTSDKYCKRSECLVLRVNPECINVFLTGCIYVCMYINMYVHTCMSQNKQSIPKVDVCI